MKRREGTRQRPPAAELAIGQRVVVRWRRSLHLGTVESVRRTRARVRMLRTQDVHELRVVSARELKYTTLACCCADTAEAPEVPLEQIDAFGGQP